MNFALESLSAIALGMFPIHTRLSGQFNHLEQEHEGVMNGCHIAAYYLDGTIGSWLPAELSRVVGW